MCALFENIFVLVSVELLRGNDFTRNRGARRVAIQDGTFELAASDAAFDDDFTIVLGQQAPALR